MKVTFGHGSPFIYTFFEGGDPTITFPDPPTVWAGSAKDAVLGVSIRKSHYGLFAPTGATWTGLDGQTFTCNLGGKPYFVIAVLPDNKPETLAFFKKYAYTLVTDTAVAWKFQDPGVMKTTFTYTTKPLEGDEKDTVFAMYPHQWKYADLKAMKMADFSYPSVRGEMKVATGTSFVRRWSRCRASCRCCPTAASPTTASPARPTSRGCLSRWPSRGGRRRSTPTTKARSSGRSRTSHRWPMPPATRRPSRSSWRNSRNA